MLSRSVRLSLIALSCLLASAAWAAQKYTITDLGTLGGVESDGAAINNSSVIVGVSTNAAGVDRAFTWDGTTMTDLGGLTVDGASGATGVNRKGRASGWANAHDGNSHAVIFSNGLITDLQKPSTGFVQSQAMGINTQGWVVGTAVMSDNAFHGWLFAQGRFKILPAGSQANGLSNQGEAVGTYKGKAIVFDLGSEIPIGTLGGSWSEADAINDTGVVTGWAATKNDKQAHAFSWFNAEMTDLGTLGGEQSQGLAISPKGVVVGWSFTVGLKHKHAFISKSGRMQDLNKLSDASGQGWELAAATGINSAGAISGTGTLNGAVHAFKLTPIK